MKRSTQNPGTPKGFSDTSADMPHHLEVGGEAELFASLRKTLKKAARGEAIKPASVMYVSPEVMRQVLVDSRARIMEYVSSAKEVPSIEAMANDLERGRSAISRDVKMLENVGLLAVRDQSHSGHGRRKSIKLAHEQLEIRLRFA